MKIKGQRISLLTDLIVPFLVLAVASTAALLAQLYVKLNSIDSALTQLETGSYSPPALAISIALAVAFVGILQWQTLFWRVRAERLTGFLLILLSAPLLFLGAPIALVSGLLGAALVYHGMYSRRATELDYRWSLRN